MAGRVQNGIIWLAFARRPGVGNSARVETMGFRVQPDH